MLLVLALIAAAAACYYAGRCACCSRAPLPEKAERTASGIELVADEAIATALDKDSASVQHALARISKSVALRRRQAQARMRGMRGRQYGQLVGDDGSQQEPADEPGTAPPPPQAAPKREERVEDMGLD